MRRKLKKDTNSFPSINEIDDADDLQCEDDTTIEQGREIKFSDMNEIENANADDPQFSEDEMSLLEEGRISPVNTKATDVKFAEVQLIDSGRANEEFLSSIASYNQVTDELKLRQENDEYINEKKIQLRREVERERMPGHTRKLTNMKITLNNLVDDVKNLFEFDNEQATNENDAKRTPSKESCDSFPLGPKQYHIEKRQIARGSLMDRILNCIGIVRSDNMSQDNTVDSFLQTYLQWTFHASFSTLFLSVFLIFIMLIVFFSGFIALAGHLKPTCITPGSSSFHDSYTLSWTTFTTVVSLFMLIKLIY